ncbi:cupin domain-containing protein [Psychroserpens luteolus]|uniref:cupin domain-containing protein n=1 Tax=Psychroserpens luteolus TaxID=2855840 RepID=UPI001E3B7C29|nr:cupin domain-containing protein [Psychroserpens luteolus]MCD2260316.1 cupin domain-containing protein [Psychroserpens luteolus]
MIKGFDVCSTKRIRSVTYLCILLLIVNCKNRNSLPDPLEAGWNNEAVCEVLEDNVKTRILKCTFAPGVGHEKHYHNPHFGYTIAGSRFRIKDTTGTKEVNVPTGYSFSKNEISVHEVLNIGDSTAVFLIIEYK